MPLKCGLTSAATMQFIVAVFFVLPTVQPVPASAQSFEFHEPEADVGKTEIESINAIQPLLSKSNPGSDWNAHEVRLSFSPTSFWKIEPGIVIQNPRGGSGRVSEAGAENIFVLKPMGKDGLSLGWFTEIEAATAHDSTNTVTYGPMIVMRQDKATFLLNPFLENTFGQNNEHGAAIDYRWYAKYEVQDHLALGVEGFGFVPGLGASGSTGPQEHRIGPSLFWDFDMVKGHPVEAQLGVLFGLTDATPDVAIRLDFSVALNTVKE